MKRLILAALLLPSLAHAAPIDDAKYLLCRDEATAALKAISGTRNYIWARDFFAPCAAPTPVPPPIVTPTQTSIPIANQTALLNALSGAKGGETFQLADGSYSFSLKGRRFPSVVTVQASRNARSGAILIEDVANLTFKGMTVKLGAGKADANAAIEINNSENVTFDGVAITGSDRSGTGIFNRRNDVKNITLRNSDISFFKYGMMLRGGDGWRVEFNKIHDLSSDGIQIGGTANAVLADNRIYNLTKLFDYHPDGIQLISPTVNTTIARNDISGGAQGVFYDGRLGTHKGLSIVGNRIAVTYSNALRIDDAEGIVSGNVITKAGQYAPIFRISNMKSDGTNLVDGVKR